MLRPGLLSSSVLAHVSALTVALHRCALLELFDASPKSVFPAARCAGLQQLHALLTMAKVFEVRTTKAVVHDLQLLERQLVCDALAPAEKQML